MMSPEAPPSEPQDSTKPHVPSHPIRELQGPFEESILDAEDDAPPDSFHLLDARARRNRLLGADEYERICSGKWRQRKGEKYHPLWKLIAQLSFGVHQLAESAAKSETESVEHMQETVDEFDGFVQRTSDDFQIAAQDIRKRIDLLEVPLRHLGVFDTMLKNPNFRLSIFRINGNIGHVAQRSFVAMQDALKDVDKALQCVDIFARYVGQVEETSVPRSPTFEAVQGTMAANVCGWNHTLSQLRAKGIELTKLLNWLSLANLELQRRATFSSGKPSDGRDDDGRPSTATTQVPTATDADSVRRHLRLLWKRINIPADATPVSRMDRSLDKPLPSHPEPLAGVDDSLINQILLTYDSSDPSADHVSLIRRHRSFDEGEKDGVTPELPSIPVASSQNLQSSVPEGLSTAWNYGHKDGNAKQSYVSHNKPAPRGDIVRQSLLWDSDVNLDFDISKTSLKTVETRSENSPYEQASDVPRSATAMSFQSTTDAAKHKHHPKRKWSISSMFHKRSDKD